MDFDKLFKKCKKDNDYLAILNKLDEAGKVEFNDWIQNSELGIHYEWMLKPNIFQEISTLLSTEQKDPFLLKSIHHPQGLNNINSIVSEGFLSPELRARWFEQFMLHYQEIDYPINLNDVLMTPPLFAVVMESILTPEEKMVFLPDLRMKIINDELNQKLLTKLFNSVLMYYVLRDIPSEQKKEIYLAVMRQIPFEDLNELPFLQYCTPEEITSYLRKNINDGNWQIALKADFGIELCKYYQFALSLEQKKALYQEAITPHVEWIIKNKELEHYIDHFKTDDEKEFIFNVYWPVLKENIKTPNKFWDIFKLFVKYQFPEALLIHAINELTPVIQKTDIQHYHFLLNYRLKYLSPEIKKHLFDIMLPQFMETIEATRDAKLRLESLTEVINDLFTVNLATQGESTIGYGRFTETQSEILANLPDVNRILNDYKSVIQRSLLDEKTTIQQKFEFLKLFPPPLGEKLLKEILSGHIKDIFKDKFDLICLIQLMRISPSHYHQELIKQMHEPIANVLSRRGVDNLIEIYSNTIHGIDAKLYKHIRDIKKIYSNENFHVDLLDLPKSIPNLFIKDGIICFDDINLEQRDIQHHKLAQYYPLKNDDVMHEKRKLVHDIEDFVLSDFGKNFCFAQQFLNLFPESKGFINAWLSEESFSPLLFKDWIASQGLNALKIIPLVFNHSTIMEQFRFIKELPLDIMILKESFLKDLEKYLDVENTDKVSSKWSIFSIKKSSRNDESLRPIYLALMTGLLQEKSAEKIVSIIQEFHEKRPQFVHEKLGENVPDSLKIFFPSQINSVTKK